MSNNRRLQLLDGLSFPDALRMAIDARGLSLDRIQHRLRQRGVSITAASLSYWRSGRSRPERPESLNAVRQLENVLELPERSLLSLLGPPRPRGRWCGKNEISTPDTLWRHASRLRIVLADANIDTSDAQGLTYFSQHDRCVVAADRHQRWVYSRMILRANRHDVGHWILVFESDTSGEQPPLVRAVRHCWVRRVITDQRIGLVVIELTFSAPLALGESLVVEYCTTYPGARYDGTGTSYLRCLYSPPREYSLEVQFTPPALPARCQQVSRLAVHEEPAAAYLPTNPSGCTHAFWLSPQPGIYGIQWDWPTAGRTR